MASGLPAIAVDRHGPAEIAGPGATGWPGEIEDAEGMDNALV